MEGIYFSAEQWAQIVREYNRIMKQSAELKSESDCLLSYLKAENRRNLDAYYIHRACKAPRNGNIVDITEHLRKRYGGQE